MRPRGINQIVRVGMLSAAVLVVGSGSGAACGKRCGGGATAGAAEAAADAAERPSTVPTLDQPVLTADPMHTHMDEERLKAMNDDRQKKLTADVDRLLALTNELKSDVAKANKDELSVTVIRKAAEIEKLAHDVQSRMKN